MLALILSLAVGGVAPAWAKPAAHSHRGHGAHVHGEGHVNLAFDGTQGRIEFEAPADSIFGFEHVARTEAHKAAQAQGLARLEGDIGKMIVFDPTLKCVFSKSALAVERESKKSSHAEVQGSFDVRCEKSPAGTTLNFRFSASFPQLKKVEVTVLIGDVQKSLESADGATIDLK